MTATELSSLKPLPALSFTTNHNSLQAPIIMASICPRQSKGIMCRNLVSSEDRSESEVCDKNISSSVSSDYKKDTSFLKSLRNIGGASTSARKKQFLRSQSVSNPKFESSKQDSRLTQQSSFSTMTSEDLQNWKSSSKTDSTSPISSSSVPKEQPVLTLASSLKDNSNITVGFTVQDDKKE